MTPQQPELRRSGHNALINDAPPPPGPDGEEAEHGPVPEANRPGHHPEHEQDKPSPERVASTLRTRPLDQQESAARVPLAGVVRAVAYGVGFAFGTAWRTSTRLAQQVRGSLR